MKPRLVSTVTIQIYTILNICLAKSEGRSRRGSLQEGDQAALLLVPGIPAISSDWFPFADRLSERFQVVVYDNRGSGRSDAPPGPYSTRQLAADAVAVLDEVGLERAHVVGVSMGGMIAQEL